MSKPKVLIYDIETSPHLIEAWGTYQTDALKIVRPQYILSFAWKWWGEKKTKVLSLPNFAGYKKDKENDKQLMAALLELYDRADIVVAHNGDKFDQKKSNAKIIYHGLTPPAPYHSIDTLKEARKHFSFPSNRLDALGEYFGVGNKLAHTGKKLWFDCMDGDMKAWKKMDAYNKQDVILLEKVFDKMLPWIKNHPILVEPTHDERCQRCDSTNIHFRGYFTSRSGVTTYRRFRCMECGGWGRARLSVREAIKPSTISI